MEELIERLRKFRDDRDWRQFHSPKNLAESVVIEAAELLEIFQWQHDGAPLNPDQEERARSEAADVLIYLLHFCDVTHIDIVEATGAKISENERRYALSSAKGVAGPLGIAE